MGGATPKQFLALNGTPMLVHTLRALLACPQVTAIIPVVPAADLARTAELLAAHQLKNIIGPVAGGDSRQASVLNGLAHVPKGTAVIAVHDAARPLPHPHTLSAAIYKAHKQQVGVVVGRPSHDTIKRVDADGNVTDTPNRTTLWQAFTPQVFPATLLTQVYKDAAASGFVGTDDASLAEHAGQPVTMLQGNLEALKVTTPQDLITAEAWLRHQTGGNPQPKQETR